MAKFASEAEMAKIVVQHLRDNEWEVYQEVQPPHSHATADIVATRGAIVWIIECKRSMSIDLLAQAWEWHGWAHRVSIAVPALRMGHGRRAFLKRITTDYGIGWLSVQQPGSRYAALTGVKQLVGPRFQRKLRGTSMRDCLTERHKTYAQAGQAKGRIWTPFKDTCEKVARVAKAKPGILLGDLLKEIDHHYSSDASAKSQISKLAREGVIDGVEVRKEKRRLRVYPTE